MKTRQPRFYFAFRSPYAWMTARLLEARFPSAHEQLDYIPFWEPDAITLDLLRAQGGDIIYTAMSRAKHFYILQDVKRLTAKFGLAMTWPVDVEPWWDLPHLAYLKARRLGKGRAFFWATYAARWERGAAIYLKDTIHDIAIEIGLDPGELLTATDDAEIRAEGAQALLRAHEDGVFGVPFFAVGYEKFWGVDRFEEFAAKFSSRVASAGPAPDPPAVVLATVGAYDTDCAGGCG
jgi:2-hydroxychromene-2-carboxylate isomerase